MPLAMSLNSSITNKTFRSFFNNADATATPTKHTHEYDWRDVTLLICFVSVFVIGVFGNALVCICFRFKSKKLRKMETLIYWLAIVDFCSSLINPTLYIYWQVTQNQHWHFGIVGCKLLPTVAKATVSISMGLIVIITIDRCNSICWPFNPEIKQKYINVALASVIILSLLFEMPNIIYSTSVPHGTCYVPEAMTPGYAYPNITIYVLRDFFILVVFILTTIFIYNSLYNKESITTLRDQKNLKQAKTTFIMILTLAIVFIVLVYPRDILHIAYMISNFNPPGIPYTKEIRDLNAALKVLHMCNSVTNVFIYAGLHGRFRVKVIRLFKGVICNRKAGLSKVTTQSDSDSTVDDVLEQNYGFETPILMDRHRFESLKETNII